MDKILRIRHFGTGKPYIPSYKAAIDTPTPATVLFTKDVDHIEEKEGWVFAQTAYHIEIPGVWDSGNVDSDKSVAIRYAGKPLESAKTYDWRVRVWDEKGAVSDWSESARWTMGKLKPEDWSARWIAE